MKSGDASRSPTFDDAHATLRPTRARYVVLASLCAVAAVAYLSREYGLSIAEKQVREELRLSENQLGMVLGTFYIGYSVFQIPGGWLGKRYGSRRMLTLFTAISSIGTLLIGFATNLHSLLALRFLIGIAQAGVFPNAANTISKWFPITQRALASGSIASFMSLGGAGAAALAALLLETMNWRWVFMLFSIPGLVWAVWFYVWFRDRPEGHSQVNEAELSQIRSSSLVRTLRVRNLTQSVGESVPTQSMGTRNANEEPVEARPVSSDDDREPTPWMAMLFSLPMWLICGQQFFRAAGFIFYPTWFPRFLKETRGVTQLQSGLLNSLPLLATVVGCLVGGLLIDRIFQRTGSRRWSRQAVAVVNLLACAALIFLAYFVQDPTGAVLLISAGSFCAAVAGPAAYTVTMDIAGSHVPVVFSVMNMCGNIAAIIVPMVVPRIVAATESWNVVLLFFAAIYVGGTICWALLNPNGTLFERVP